MNAELQNKIDELSRVVKTQGDKLVALDNKSRLVTENKDRLSIPLSPVEKDVINRQIIYPISVRLKNTDAATAANYGAFFVADKTYIVNAVTEVHGTAGSDAGAVTLQIERLQGTEAPDSGDVLLSTALNLKGTANTVQYGTLITTNFLILGRGDRLCLKDAGVLTAVADVVVTIYLRNI